MGGTACEGRGAELDDDPVWLGCTSRSETERDDDAAWAGPLRLSDNFTNILDGIENADSVSISGHKWFFQPKESGLILFKDVLTANKTISATSGYLTTENVGILGSHGAIALPLMATLIAWGKTGFT